MADALKTFREGEDILASETNDNNQYLLSKLSDNAAQVQQYVEGEVATIKSNVASVQATLQNNIDELRDKVEADALARVFVEKSLDVAVGTVDLASYLPDDEYQYLVWVNGWYGRNGAGEALDATTDIMLTKRRLYWCDSDAGRHSRGLFFGSLPVGTGRTITFSGTAASLALCGYQRM